MTEAIEVLVTGVGGGGVGAQILKALRLADTQYEITAVDLSSSASGFRSADHAETIPAASASSYVDAILDVCERRRVRVVFPGSEPELEQLSSHRDSFADRNILLPINTASLIETCFDKYRTMEALSAFGFAVPAYMQISTIQEASMFGHLPAVLKPSVGGGGSAHVYLAQERDEFLAYANHLLGLFPEFIAQEYVGTTDREYTIGVLSNMEGAVVNSIALRREIMTAVGNKLREPNRSGRPELGPMLAISSGFSQGTIGRLSEVVDRCEEMARALKSCGPLNIQGRLFNDEIYVFEINPRFSGSTSIRAMVGFNEPDYFVRRYILGERIPAHFPYHHGVIMRELTETLLEISDEPE